MKLMVCMLVWYAMSFGIFLIQAGLNRRRAGKPARPQAPVMVLKEGETIVGVADWPDTMRFYIKDVVDEKSYE